MDAAAEQLARSRQRRVPELGRRVARRADAARRAP